MRVPIVVLMVMVILFSACSLAAPEATSAPTRPPSPQPLPTLTLLPSLTPSAQPSPTRTLTRTASPMPTVTPSATRYPTPLLRVTEIVGASCPFNQPVKVIAPGADPSGINWQPVIKPMGDACVSRMRIAPNDARTWYVGGQTALYITRDEGKTWERPFTSQVGAIEIDPSKPERVLVGFQVAKTLYESTDKGRTWRLLRKFDQELMSLLISKDGTIYVGFNWGSSPSANGVYASRDQGATWQNMPFGTEQRGLILWDIAQDPRDLTLYIGTEIYDHPKPYDPPFFRSRDGGKTWQEISGALPWHVIALSVSAQDGTVYALTEGAGFYYSPNHGDKWIFLAHGPSISFATDPSRANRLFGGALASPQHRMEGGVYLSTEGGKNFTLIGLRGVTISSVVFSPDGKTLFAVAYTSGIYRALLPE